MSSFQNFAFRIFREYTKHFMIFFPDLKKILKKSDMPYTTQEYLSMSMLISLIALILFIPVFSLLFTILVKDILFSILFAILSGLVASVGLFFGMIKYPLSIIKSKESNLNNSLPFALLYLATISSSKLPLFKTLNIFTKFSSYGEIKKQINNINNDTKLFGLDIITALERAVERSPSKNFSELLYGLLSTIRAGGDMNIYLKQKSINFMNEYKRKLHEFSNTLTLFIEIYLTAIILGAIFFTILTAIISAIGGGGEDIIILQFILIFLFMPLISIMFIYLIKSSTPGEE